jgi:hypothetical protein
LGGESFFPSVLRYYVFDLLCLCLNT